MKIKKLIPEIVVKDVSSSIDFYTSMLNFNLDAKFPESDHPSWAKVSSGEIEIMFQEWNETVSEMPKLKNRAKGGITILMMKMHSRKEVEQISETLNNFEIALPLRETEYGSVEFGISDPDGYIILFSSD